MRFSDLFRDSLWQLKDFQRALEVELLIAQAFALDRPQFWSRQQEEITDAEGLHDFNLLFARLLSGEPLTYILGHKEFFSLDFIIERGALIPRPETELLVETALTFLQKQSVVLDIGAGSGVISVVLAEKRGCRVIALEKSRRALTVLQLNIEKFQIAGLIFPVQADLFPDEQMRFNLIISNPPYLSINDWQHLPPHIKEYEPKMALVAGKNGTEIIERIIGGASQRLLENGYLLIEVGAGQMSAIEQFLKKSFFRRWHWVKDLQGIDRVLVVQK